MIVLDTNVISEAWKISPNAKVVAWIDDQLVETLYLSTITLAEIRYGLAVMPKGKRRKTLLERLENDVLPAFIGRILAFDLDATRAYAHLMAPARHGGQSIPTVDGYIAAIAKANNCAIATRDSKPFEAAGLTVVNPWTA